MIITPDSLDISQPKTGSTWRRRHLAPIIGAATQCSDGKNTTHAGHSPLIGFSREAIATRKVRAVVRNPFDHLVSIYCHMRGSIAKSPQIRHQFSFWANGEPTWEAILYGWTHPHLLPHPPDRRDHVYNPGALSHEAWMLFGAGFWSWHLRYFHGLHKRGMPLGADLFIDCAQQSEAYAALYPEHADAILDGARANVGSTAGDWWTPEREQWVYSADGRLIEAMGYTDGPGTASTRGPMWTAKESRL